LAPSIDNDEDENMIKTLTFGAFTVAQGLSGSLLVGGAIALVEPAIKYPRLFLPRKTPGKDAAPA